MALVPAGSDFDDASSVAMSNTSYVRGVNAQEQARRRLKAMMEQKEKQCELMRQTVERKKKHLDDVRGDVQGLRDAKEQDENTIAELKEEKLVFRLFKQLDVEKKNAVTLDNICNKAKASDTERAFIDENLFKVLPKTYHITLKAKDFDSTELLRILMEDMGIENEAAFEVQAKENAMEGTVKVTLRLIWSTHPAEIAENEALSEEENEERRQQIEAYYAALGGSGNTVEPEAAHQKEEEMIDIVQAKIPAVTEWEVVRVNQELRATFADFISTFWFVVVDEVPVCLKVMYQDALRIEEDTILPEEALDKVVELEHAIKLQQKVNEEVIRDTNLTEKDIQAVDKQIDSVAKELGHIQRVTGFDNSNNKKEHIDWNLQEEQILHLTELVQTLEREHSKGVQVLKKKTELLVRLSEEVEEKKEVEEQVFKCQNDINVVNKEMDEVREETNRLMKYHDKSDRAITVLEEQRDVVAVDSLQNDKQYLQRQISSHVSAKGESDRIIKAQAFRLGVLENRLGVVTNALKDLKSDQKIQRRLKDALTLTEDDDVDPTNLEAIMPANELIDIELYELLNRDLEAITTSMKLKNIILHEKEATIEATELKLRDLQEDKEEDEAYYYYTTQKDLKEVDELHHQRRIRQENQRRERDGIKRGVAASRRKASDMLRAEA
eukprot:TRINITY_DN3845_c6_g1_i1.p1 TRINITY_DN3845_c6_g1~~TRINITY_DN3845_c6_g1_i1.p1  ORF type:complete len:667 (+),score=318.37 TRINITY_DN3845_c6_g1_i1:40-2040(+)